MLIICRSSFIQRLRGVVRWNRSPNEGIFITLIASGWLWFRFFPEVETLRNEIISFLWIVGAQRRCSNCSNVEYRFNHVPHRRSTWRVLSALSLSGLFRLIERADRSGTERWNTHTLRWQVEIQSTEQNEIHGVHVGDIGSLSCLSTSHRLTRSAAHGPLSSHMLHVPDLKQRANQALAFSLCSANHGVSRNGAQSQDVGERFSKARHRRKSAIFMGQFCGNGFRTQNQSCHTAKIPAWFSTSYPQSGAELGYRSPSPGCLCHPMNQVPSSCSCQHEKTAFSSFFFFCRERPRKNHSVLACMISSLSHVLPPFALGRALLCKGDLPHFAVIFQPVYSYQIVDFWAFQLLLVSIFGLFCSTWLYILLSCWVLSSSAQETAMPMMPLKAASEVLSFLDYHFFLHIMTSLLASYMK